MSMIPLRTRLEVTAHTHNIGSEHWVRIQEDLLHRPGALTLMEAVSIADIWNHMRAEGNQCCVILNYNTLLLCPAYEDDLSFEDNLKGTPWKKWLPRARFTDNRGWRIPIFTPTTCPLGEIYICSRYLITKVQYTI